MATTTRKRTGTVVLDEAVAPEADFEGAFGPSGAKKSAPEAKTQNCEGCNQLFVPQAGETTCAQCIAKAAARRQAIRPGYVLCDVVCEGEVVADAFVGGELKKSFRNGDRAEFAQADIDSLPGMLIPVKDGAG